MAKDEADHDQALDLEEVDEATMMEIGDDEEGLDIIAKFGRKSSQYRLYWIRRLTVWRSRTMVTKSMKAETVAATNSISSTLEAHGSSSSALVADTTHEAASASAIAASQSNSDSALESHSFKAQLPQVDIVESQSG